MLRGAKNANLRPFRPEDEAEIIKFLEIYDRSEKTILRKVFHFVYVTTDEYSFGQLSIILHCSIGSVHNYIAKINVIIDIITTLNKKE